MRFLVDINHPHQVHFFRNAMLEWQKRGDCVLITARNKDLTTDLLVKFGFRYNLNGEQRPPSFLNFARGVIETDINVLRLARKFRPDWLMGTSFAASHVGRLVGARSIVFAEDSFDSSPMFWRLALPFANFVATPSSITDNYGEKHITYNGNQELAYLHPNYFTPDEKILDGYQIDPREKFFILRFVSLAASHDLGQRGLRSSLKHRLVNELAQYGRVFITSEEPLRSDLEPYKLTISPEHIHHVLAYAALLVSDSQSMTIEAAVLGTPSIRCNTFVGRTPVIEELEQKYQLTFGFSPEEEKSVLNKVQELLSIQDLKSEWATKRQKLLSEKIDVTNWLVNLPGTL